MGIKTSDHDTRPTRHGAFGAIYFALRNGISPYTNLLANTLGVPYNRTIQRPPTEKNTKNYITTRVEHI